MSDPDQILENKPKWGSRVEKGEICFGKYCGDIDLWIFFQIIVNSVSECDLNQNEGLRRNTAQLLVHSGGLEPGWYGQQQGKHIPEGWNKRA